MEKLKEKIKQIYQYRYALWNMVVSQLKAKYAGSLLGISCAVINPLLIMLVITFVFSNIAKIEINNFYLFILSGLFPWMFFSNCLNDATGAISNQKSVLHQFSFPREFFPLSSVFVNFLNFLIGLCVIFPLFVFANFKIVFFFPWLVLIIFLNLLFVIGFGVFFSILNVFYRDLSQLLGVILMFWFWITPVFYSVEMIPLGWRWIFNINPMTYYIVCYRDVLFECRLPVGSVFTGVLFCSIISLSAGFFIFYKYEDQILKKA